MEIKIQCGCGSRFAFEVQPIYGRMPGPVACPRCGCDHTEACDRQIALNLAPPPLHDGRRGLKILNLPGYDHPEPDPDADEVLVSIPQPGIQTLPVGGKTNHTTELDIPITDNSSAAPHLQDAVTAAIASSNIPIIPGGGAPPAGESSGHSTPTPPVPGGLRVRQNKKGQTTVVIAPPLPPVEDVTPTLKRKPVATTPAYDDDPPQGFIGWLKAGGKAIAGTFIALLVVLKFIGKFKLAKLLAIFGIGAASHTADLPTDEWNFWYEDTTQIYVQVDDPQKVVTACTAYWTAQGKTLNTSTTDSPAIQPKHYLVSPAHQGYVVILGALDWDPQFVNGLALNLSTQFSSTVMTFAENDFSGAHRFAVYQSGLKSFSHQLNVQVSGNDAVESVQMEGESWVVERGYFKPDSDGFQNFDMEHINHISQQLGLQWWDFPEDAKGYHDLSEP
jgi:cell division septation protein DedD